MSTANTLRALLLIDIVVIALLAIFFLRERRLSWLEYCGWGLLAVMIPLLGPFLVILSRPGVWRIAPPVGFFALSNLFQTRRRFAFLGPRPRKKYLHRE
jgi:hypothetical protein